jgi:hypothetical protein
MLDVEIHADDFELLIVSFESLSTFFLVLSFLLLRDSVQSFTLYLCFKLVDLCHRNPFPNHCFKQFLSFSFLGNTQEALLELDIQQSILPTQF